jgi:pimeloyl-ACP methyl ester carboxylesterase
MPPPGDWNGDVVIFAHGYVPTTMPVDIPWSQMELPGGLTLPALTNSLGYAFATTSYSENGLAVVQGVIDILDLVEVFNTTVGTPNHIYLVGASEGGLVTTLAVERHPGVFAGGMAMCGPIGDFRGQVNYWGDFRVLFDYFLPGALPPSPVNIPQYVIGNWDDNYAPHILAALSANPFPVEQLMSVSQAPYDPTKLGTVGETVLGVLWYNAFATNDAIEKLRGQPFDNQSRVYLGSSNDQLLNQTVERFTADKLALNRIDKKYETSGELKRPLIVLHTTADPIVPAWHAALYTDKVLANNKGGLYQSVIVPRYGHCSFTLDEILSSFGWLVQHAGQEVDRSILHIDPSRANELYSPYSWLTSAGKK